MNERNPDPNSKRQVAKWYREHPECQERAEKVIATMRQDFEAKSGYINKKDKVEYRFGSSRCIFGDAQLFVTQKHVRVRFWLKSKGQRLKAVGTEQRKTLKSATGADMFAVDFVIFDDSTLKALQQFLAANDLPNWARNAREVSRSNANVLNSGFGVLSSTKKTEVLREVWMRGPAHDRFKRKLKKLWNDQCSVHGDSANELLVASHILSWSASDGSARENPLNGLLLSAPLDKLFDRHLISFDEMGKILLSPALTAQTKSIFAVNSDMRLRWSHISEEERRTIRAFLATHRKRYRQAIPARSA